MEKTSDNTVGKYLKCKDCISEYRKQYRESNKEKVAEGKKIWVENNKEKVREMQSYYYESNKELIIERSRIWSENNKEKSTKSKKKYVIDNIDIINERSRLNYKNNKEVINKRRNEVVKEKRRNDNNFRIRTNIRSLITFYFNRKGIFKSKKCEVILGISYNEFILYIESKMEDWMTWENYGKYNGELNYGWDMDHILPISSGKTEEDMIILNHYTNLQPLCSKVNRDIKKDRLDYK